MPSAKEVVGALAGAWICAIVGGVFGVLVAAACEESRLVRYTHYYQSLSAAANCLLLGGATAALSHLGFTIRGWSRRSVTPADAG